MGRLSADLTAKLPIMQASRRKVTPGQKITGSELAEMAGTTWRILKARVLHDPAFPVLVRGADGKPWSFDAVASLDHLIAHNAQLKKRRARRAAESARLAGFSSSPVEAGGPVIDTDKASIAGEAADRAADARALKALAEAQMMVHRLKVQQGEYVRASEHQAVLSDIMTTLQTEMLAMAARSDQTGSWPVELRESVETYQRNVLLHLQRAVDAVLQR